MATSNSDSELHRLAAQNQALSEELAQCQADKEFVWSLWKRLQVANPDISQGISLVVQREKEKAELKDRKILEILHAKDDRIAELEQMISDQDKRLTQLSESTNESTNVKEEFAALQGQIEQEKKKAKEQLQQQADDMNAALSEKEDALQRTTEEKEALQVQVSELQLSIDESRTELKKIEDLNTQYQKQVQELELGLEEVVKKAKLASHELDSKTEGLKKAKTKLQELTLELKKSGHELHSARLEYEELKAEHSRAIHQASQQAQLIQQLQTLQADTHKVLANQESAHNMESTSFQKMYHELRAQYEKLVHSERVLKQRLAEVESHVTSKEPMRSVSLQVNLDRHSDHQSRSRSRSKSRSEKGHTPSEDLTENTRTDVAVERRAVSEGTVSHADQVNGQHSTPDRATSTPVKHPARRARSLSPTAGGSTWRQGGAHREPGAPWSHGRISDFLDAAERGGGGREARKKEDLRKLLRLKNQEVEELRKAHSRRLERLRTLQSAYDVIKEQIKTYEQHESQHNGKGKRKKMPRPGSKELRREDSDGVWNELTHYKLQTANLIQEQMNLEEEVDRLRVQAAADASTIEDLTRCLEDERNGLENQLARLQAANRREEREKTRAEELYEKNKRLHKSLHALQSKQEAWEEEREEAERQLRFLRAELVQTKTATTHGELEHQAVLDEVNKLKRKVKKLSRRSHEDDRRKEERQSVNDEDDRDPSAGIHIILHDGDDQENEDDQDDHQDFFHSTPRKSRARMRSRSFSPSKSRPSPNTRPRSRPHSSSHFSRSRSQSSSRNRSLSAGAPCSPSKRELTAVLHHLDRMAQAYQGSPPVYKTLLQSVATQTERVVYAESGMMTDTEGSDSVASLSTEGAVFPGIVPLSLISRRTDAATSPIKGLSITSQTITKRATKTRGQSPGPGGVNALKRRLGALQQQLASLQEQRNLLQKAAVEEKEANQTLRTDLTLANSRHHNSKITIQRLTHDLDEAKKQKDLLMAEDLAKQSSDKHSEAEWKSAETRLKSQANEIVRQGGAIKAMKSEKEGLNDIIKGLESRIQHLERDVSQKRSLLDDLRARAKAANDHDKIHAETVDMLEAKMAGLNEVLDKRKVELDSLRKRVAVVTKEKHHYEQLCVELRSELEKKSAVLKETTSKVREAESTLSEVEMTASQQLQLLANQSEAALDAAHVKMKQLQARIKDLEGFIQDLAAEFSSQAQSALDRAHQVRTNSSGPDLDQEKDQSMVRAQTIASSILNMSTKDLEVFMEEEREQERTKGARKTTSKPVQDEEWRKQFETALSAKKLQKKWLKELMMKKIEDRDQAVLSARDSR